MPTRVVRRSAVIEGQREAQALAATLGGVVRAARRARRMTLDQLAARVGLSRSRLSQIERGEGHNAALGTWIALGIAIGRPFAAQMSKPLAASASLADAGHLPIQEHVLALARATGRPGTFELPTRPTDPSRSTDVGIHDRRHRVRILAECWNRFGDLGAAARATNRKAAEAAATWPDDRIATVWIVRASEADRRLLAAYPHILEAAFPGSSRRWVRALTVGDLPPPRDPGLVWFDGATGRITEQRRATIAA